MYKETIYHKLSSTKRSLDTLKFLLLLFILSWSLLAISQEQLQNLQIVRDVAKTIPDKYGETYENTLSAICLTESSAGKNIIGDAAHAPLTKASLGIMQIQLNTARFIAKRIPSLAWINEKNDAQIAALLLQDVELSARIATHYIVLLKHARKAYLKVVSGYNGGMINRPYYRRVMKNMKLVHHLVKKGSLS